MTDVPSAHEPAEDAVEGVDDVSVVAEVDDSEDEDLLVLESVDEPWELPVWEPTGQARVDEALEGLSRIDLDDVHTHADAYADIHRQLRDTLSDLDTST